MNYHLNTYEACPQHIDGNQPTCLLCEIDALRGLLRKVANADADKTWCVEYTTLWIPKDLWQQIAPLRDGDADASR